MLSGFLQVILRLSVVITLLLIISRYPETPSPEVESLPVQPTGNRQLQLLRLYDQTNGVWTEAQLEERKAILGIRPEPVVSISERERLNEWQAVETALLDQDDAALKERLARILEREPDHQQANFWMGLLLLPDTSALPYLQTAAGLEGDDQANAASILSIAQIPGYQPRDMALHLVQMGLWGFAERLFTMQIEQDNLDAFSFAYRGYVRDQQSKDGLSDIEMALALDPGLALGYYMLGLHERQADNLDDSLNAFLEATLLDPYNPALAAELATAYRLNSALPLAEEWYIKAASLAPEDQRFIGLLAAFYAENGYKLDGVGMEFLQQAAEEYPENPDLLTSLGAAQLVIEDIQGAEDSLQAAFLLAPRDPRVRYFMGQLMVAQRNRVEAISHFFFVTQTENPYTAAAQDAIEQLSR